MKKMRRRGLITLLFSIAIIASLTAVALSTAAVGLVSGEAPPDDNIASDRHLEQSFDSSSDVNIGIGPADDTSSSLLKEWTLEELTLGADCIVVGTVTDIVTQAEGKYGGVNTLVTLFIDEWLKGSSASEVTIIVSGGQVEEGHELAAGTPSFSVQERILLFLERSDEDMFVVRGGSQGKYIINDGKVVELGLPLMAVKTEISDTLIDYGLSSQQPEMVMRTTSEVLNIPEAHHAIAPEGNQEPPQTGWSTIMTENFEGAFPGTTWSLYGDPTWNDDDYKPHWGYWSGWCAASAYDPQYYYYPNNMDAWMVYGPFDLSDATDAELNFWFWLESEFDYDWLAWYASTNNVNYYGYHVSGDSAGWQYRSFDLTNVPTLGNLCGQPQVWIAFRFESDSSNVDDGAFVDDIELSKEVEPECNLVNIRNVSAPSTVDAGEQFTVSFEYYGTGPTDFPYEFRWVSTTDGGDDIDCHVGDATACQWHPDSFLLTAPSTEGTYTWYVAGYGSSSSSGMCGGANDDNEPFTFEVIHECNLVNIRNVSAPSTVDAGEQFTVSFEYYGTGPTDFPYEFRWVSETDGGEDIDCHVGDATACQWHPDSFLLTAPSTEGTYTWYVAGYGSSFSSGMCGGSYDDNEPFTFEVSVIPPDIRVEPTHLDFECPVAGSNPSTAVTSNPLDFECTTATSSPYETAPSSDKIEMILIDSPPTPPVNVSHTIINVDHLPASAVILNDVPTSEWTYGCTATSAGMLFGYYDRTGYPDMYTGSTNGGVCPLTDLGQGIPTNPRYPIPGSCYIMATENGLDGISSNAHVDDYWISYGSAGPDPWEGTWPEHTWELCTADFLGTNQWKWDYSSYPGTDGVIDANVDGATTLVTANDGSKLYDWCPGPAYGTPTTACCHGMMLFAESRGYTVEANYNQLTDNQHSNGFTFAEFQAEIDAGRPVLIQLTLHTMVGVGYDAATNNIYIHDTWDNSVHSMTWGGSYAGMDLRAVTVIHLAPLEGNCKTVTVYNDGSGSLSVTDIVIRYQPGESTSWLDATPKSFTVAPAGSAQVNVCVECAGLDPGTYHGWLDIYSNDPDENPVTVSVVLQDPQTTYDLTVTSDGCCPTYVGAPVNDTVAEGTSQTFTDIAAGTNVSVSADDSDPCCDFDSWSDGGAQTHNVYMDSNKSVTATCTDATYDLTVDQTTSCCAVDVSGGATGTVAAYTSQTFYGITCNAFVYLDADSAHDCTFDQWTGDIDLGALVDPNRATMNADKTVTADCSIEENYDLTVVSDGCCPIDVGAPVNQTVAAGASQTFFNIAAGTNVNVSADDSDPCCDFVSWSDGGAQTHNVYMDSNKSVTATCVEPTYDLTVDQTTSCCAVDVSGGATGTVAAGTSQTFTGITCNAVVDLDADDSAPDCTFTSWTGDVDWGAGVDPNQVTMNADKTVTAHCDGTWVVRDLPDYVLIGGDPFDVTVTFTAPENDFNAIGLTDFAPSGWTVSANTAWCTPNANAAIATGNKAEIAWYGPYPSGTEFTAVYKVSVPPGTLPGTYEFADGSLEYHLGGTGPYTAYISGDFLTEATPGTLITGVTREVNCDLLPDVTVTLFKDSVPVGSTTSDEFGYYEIVATELGNYDVEASKTGFCPDEVQSISITELGGVVEVNFEGAYGLIPEAPTMSYALSCVNLWLYPPPGGCALSMQKALAVINKWLYPGCGG